ncbi:hypothetical protein evm_002712 [Chilo suppressalis]|nr:hypothetical protein evm_002712 [Chilo suppressalis]
MIRLQIILRYKKAEMENIPLLDLLPDKDKEGKTARLRLSSETEGDTSTDITTDQSRDKSTDTSHDKTIDTSRDKSTDKSRDTTHNKTETRVNTAPRRAMPISISPPRPTKSRRKLFTNREADVSKNKGSEEESDQSEDGSRKPVTRVRVPKPSTRDRRDLARAERMAKRLVAACAPAVARAPALTNTAQPRIVLTGMSRSERRSVTEAIRSLNGRIQSRVNKSTTHVLLGSCQQSPAAGTNPGNECNNSAESVVHRSDIIKARTLNALLGAARGTRVLYARWGIESATRGQWLHHHEYIVPHLKKIAEKARIERTALGRLQSEYAYDVFSGMLVKITPEAEQRDAAIQLLKLCGGFVQDGGTQQNGDHDLTIGVGDGEVNSKWVFDSVAAARMRTTRRYVNNTISNTFVTQTTDR